MTAKVKIIDGAGESHQAEVDQYHNLFVAHRFPEIPPSGTLNRYRYYSALLGSTGADSGTTNQNVNGSVNPQIFYIESDNDYDIHVMGISVLLADGSVSLSKFGALAALATGWDLGIRESGETTWLVYHAQTGGVIGVTFVRNFLSDFHISILLKIAKKRRFCGYQTYLSDVIYGIFLLFARGLLLLSGPQGKVVS